MHKSAENVIKILYIIKKLLEKLFSNYDLAYDGDLTYAFFNDYMYNSQDLLNETFLLNFPNGIEIYSESLGCDCVEYIDKFFRVFAYSGYNTQQLLKLKDTLQSFFATIQNGYTKEGHSLFLSNMQDLKYKAEDENRTVLMDICSLFILGSENEVFEKLLLIDKPVYVTNSDGSIKIDVANNSKQLMFSSTENSTKAKISQCTIEDDVQDIYFTELDPDLTNSAQGHINLELALKQQKPAFVNNFKQLEPHLQGIKEWFKFCQSQGLTCMIDDKSLKLLMNYGESLKQDDTESKECILVIPEDDLAKACAICYEKFNKANDDASIPIDLQGLMTKFLATKSQEHAKEFLEWLQKKGVESLFGYELKNQDSKLLECVCNESFIERLEIILFGFGIISSRGENYQPRKKVKME